MAKSKGSNCGEPCRTCRYRADGGPWDCNYADVMGVTKRKTHPDAPMGALAGPGCLCYERGRRMERPCRVGRKKPRPERPQAALSQDARWESMRAMHRQGGNDVQIAGEMGCSVSAVRRWRVRQGLPPNSRDGWNKRRERRTDNG